MVCGVDHALQSDGCLQGDEAIFWVMGLVLRLPREAYLMMLVRDELKSEAPSAAAEVNEDMDSGTESSASLQAPIA